MTRKRPFRFGLQAAVADSSTAWRELAVRGEALGFDIMLMPDHIGARFAYGPALMSVAASTSLRIGSLVLDNDFRHPAITASEAWTLHVLTGGRFELGIGAGWMLEDYESSGIPFDPPGVRIDRLVESLAIIKPLLRGESVDFTGDYYQVKELDVHLSSDVDTSVPVLIGAGGPRLLGVAAREADIVGIVPPALPGGGLAMEVSREVVARQVAQIEQAAGPRIDEIELQIMMQQVSVTDKPEQAIDELATRWNIQGNVLRDSPHVLFGSVESITETLIQRREETGISYIVVRPPAMEEFAPVIANLAGR